MTCPKWARRDQRRALQAGLIESRRALMLCRWLMVDQVETEQVGQALSPANPQTRIHRKRSHKKYVTQFAMFSSTCSFSPPAWYSPYATFELGKEVCARRNLSRPLLAGQQALLFRWY